MVGIVAEDKDAKKAKGAAASDANASAAKKSEKKAAAVKKPAAKKAAAKTTAKTTARAEAKAASEKKPAAKKTSTAKTASKTTTKAEAKAASEKKAEKKSAAKKTSATKTTSKATSKTAAKAAAEKKTAKKRASAKAGAETASGATDTSRPASHNIRMSLKGFDPRLVDHSVRRIVEAVTRTGTEIRGPVPLPVRKERITVLISPHKHKDARDQYEIRSYKRILDVISPTEKTMDALRHFNLSAGVDISIKMIHSETARSNR